MIVYKIRNKKTGLFSTGSAWPSWSEKGKTYNKQGHITSHLSNALGYNRAKDFYKDAEIVEFELTETETKTMPIIGYIDEKIAASEAEYKRYQERLERQKYEQAQKVVDEYRGKQNV